MVEIKRRDRKCTVLFLKKNLESAHTTVTGEQLESTSGILPFGTTQIDERLLYKDHVVHNESS